MRKGLLIGAIIGFLAGLVLKTYGSWTTGMVSLSPDGAYILASSFVVTLFVASSCGIIGAFIGALLQDLIEKR